MPAEPALRDVELHPVTPDRWPDLEAVFGPKGAFGDCWCMWPRLRSRDFRSASGAQNKAALKGLVDAGRPPGLLAYAEGEPVGWISLAPREEFTRLEHSRTLKRVDDRPVWSVVCFVVRRGRRGRGLMSAMLKGAIAYARRNGAQVLEGYPVEKRSPLRNYDGYTGIISTFRQAGFQEVARPSERQAIMRYEIER